MSITRRTQAPGRQENTKEKDYTNLEMELNMMENGSMENIMELELLFGLMEVFTKESGKKVFNMAKVKFMFLARDTRKEHLNKMF